MIKPAPIRPIDSPTVVGKIFGTPIVVVGKTWLPITEFIVVVTQPLLHNFSEFLSAVLKEPFFNN